MVCNTSCLKHVVLFIYAFIFGNTLYSNKTKTVSVPWDTSVLHWSRSVVKVLQVPPPSRGSRVVRILRGTAATSLRVPLSAAVCPNDEPCAAIYVCTLGQTDRTGGPMKASRHIEVVKSKPKGRRSRVLVAITSCSNSWLLEEKKKKLKKCRPAQRLRSAAGLEPSGGYFAFNDVAAGASGLGM